MSFRRKEDRTNALNCRWGWWPELQFPWDLENCRLSTSTSEKSCPLPLLGPWDLVSLLWGCQKSRCLGKKLQAWCRGGGQNLHTLAPPHSHSHKHLHVSGLWPLDSYKVKEWTPWQQWPNRLFSNLVGEGGRLGERNSGPDLFLFRKISNRDLLLRFII